MKAAWQTLFAIIVGVAPALALADADLDPSRRTAAMPDSWLVLYNLNDADSVSWKTWYIEQWGIPAENTLGLDVTAANERVEQGYFEARLFNPVVAFLAGRPQLKARIMGIVVGYHVPGNFYLDNNHPSLPGGGGWSVANNLADLTSVTWFKRPNPHAFVAWEQRTERPLTKATLSEGCYMTARLDGPTLAGVQALTQRARALTTSPDPLPAGEKLYYDYTDIGAPGGDRWRDLQYAVSGLSTPAARFPWSAFESKSDATPDCALQFSYYRLTGWNTVNWGGSPSGARILGYALNSWGATTVRSTTDHGARYVPNALFSGHFAAAVGATAEPSLGTEPDPSTIVWCLAGGWTLGEAVFRANIYRNHMWELVGDPLLAMPHWFGRAGNAKPNAPTGLGQVGSIAAGTTTTPSLELDFAQSDPDLQDLLAYHVEIDNDGDFSSPIVDYTGSPQPQGSAVFVIGQESTGGSYAVGGPGQPLPPGTYYWRVASSDGAAASDWAVASNGAPAFVVADSVHMAGAVSRKAHGGMGTFDVDLMKSSGQIGVEGRSGGPLWIIVRFNRAVRKRGILDPVAVTVTSSNGPAGGKATLLAINGGELSIQVAGTPANARLTLAFPGVEDLDGNPVIDTLCLGLLAGDVVEDGKMNVADLVRIRNVFSQNLDNTNFRADIDADGAISVLDLVLARQNMNNSVPGVGP